MIADFIDCHRDRLTVTFYTIADAHVKDVLIRTLRFGGRPGEGASCSDNGGTSRSVHQAEGEGLNRQVGVRGCGSKAQGA